MRSLALLIALAALGLMSACGGAAPEPPADQAAAATDTIPTTAATGYPAPVELPAYPAPAEAYPSADPPGDETAGAGLTEEPMPNETTPPPGRPVATTSAALGPLLEAVAQDLSQALAIPVNDVTVVRAEAVVWPDAGLGCPDPDRMYAQVQVEGMRITLAAAGEEYAYHTEGLSRFVRCEDGRPVSEGVVPQRR